MTFDVLLALVPSVQQSIQAAVMIVVAVGLFQVGASTFKRIAAENAYNDPDQIITSDDPRFYQYSLDLSADAVAAKKQAYSDEHMYDPIGFYDPAYDSWLAGTMVTSLNPVMPLISSMGLDDDDGRDDSYYESMFRMADESRHGYNF